jgi:hypothetical protein
MVMVLAACLMHGYPGPLMVRHAPQPLRCHGRMLISTFILALIVADVHLYAVVTLTDS